MSDNITKATKADDTSKPYIVELEIGSRSGNEFLYFGPFNEEAARAAVLRAERQFDVVEANYHELKPVEYFENGCKVVEDAEAEFEADLNG